MRRRHPTPRHLARRPVRPSLPSAMRPQIRNQRPKSTRRSLCRSQPALVPTNPTETASRFSCPRYAWSECRAPRAPASMAAPLSRLSQLTRSPQSSIEGLRSPRECRGRPVIKASAVTASPRRPDMHRHGGVTKVIKASRAVSGEAPRPGKGRDRPVDTSFGGLNETLRPRSLAIPAARLALLQLRHAFLASRLLASSKVATRPAPVIGRPSFCAYFSCSG
jgi:hypothetical protein